MQVMTISRLERVWLTIGVGMLAIFLALIVVAAIEASAAPPSSTDIMDPQAVLASAKFQTAGPIKTGPDSYMVHVAAFTFSFQPSTITVPVGAKVTFHIASSDVVHGFEIVGTDVNTMVVPGYVSVVTHTFTHKGTYLILCNEYCGGGHQLMSATLTVA
jgi:cytochrome c oxidase subunit 2